MDKGSCGPLGMVSYILLIVGGLNWGLVGVSYLAGSGWDGWNVVRLLLGSWPMVEAIVYILVGLSAICAIFACKSCKK